MTELPADTFPGLRSRGATVTLLGVTQILAWGSSYYLPAVLAGAIASDTGWPLTLVVGGLSLGLVVAGLVSPAVGSRIGRGHGRIVLAASSFFLAAGLLCLGLANTAARLSRRMDHHRRRHGRRPLRRGLCRARHALRPRSKTHDHRAHLVRRIGKHRMLAAQRLPPRASWMARHVPRLCMHPARASRCPPTFFCFPRRARRTAERRGERSPAFA